MHWAEHFAREEFQFTASFNGLTNIKFQQIIEPGQAVRLTLTLAEKEDRTIVGFAYSSTVGKHASGKLTFN
jgi:3-hydroxymyristoyl/3-hydroxydecanoyl-(acyl carrier protein) dehydratase